MAVDQKQETLRDVLLEALALDRSIEALLERERDAMAAHPATATAVARIHESVRTHREALERYLAEAGIEATGGDERPAVDLAPGSGRDGGRSLPLSRQLREVVAACSRAAAGYAILHALAMRLFEPPLRELAPRHLRTYAEAVHAINRLVPPVVAWESMQEGLYCACTCPMCSVGACGCVSVASEALDAAWRETIPSEDTEAGFELQEPRPQSQLAKAGVQAGERLLSVDDTAVASFRDVQAGLRGHQPGEAVRLQVRRGSDEPREIVVRRADG